MRVRNASTQRKNVVRLNIADIFNDELSCLQILPLRLAMFPKLPIAVCKSITQPPARSVTTGQIRAEAAQSSVRLDDTATVVETNVRATVTSTTVAAITLPGVATVDVDRCAAVEETAIDTKATSPADRNC
jgi:hypothetical protein